MTLSLTGCLCERYGVTDIPLAMDALLGEKFGTSGTNGIPCNVHDLAEDCGLSIEVLDGFPSSGLLTGTGDRELILVNGRDHPYRQRFTVAHELMHFILRSLVAETKGDCLDEEESLCNLGASLLLIPREYFERECGTRRASTSLIRAMREDCEVSYEFAATTLALRHSGCFLVAKWKQDKDENLVLERASRSDSFPYWLWLDSGHVVQSHMVFARWVADYSGTKQPGYFVLTGPKGKEYLDADHLTLGRPGKRYVLSILHTRPSIPSESFRLFRN